MQILDLHVMYYMIPHMTKKVCLKVVMSFLFV